MTKYSIALKINLGFTSFFCVFFIFIAKIAIFLINIVYNQK